ncbi:MAG: DUF4469 domain-containing protein [Tannerellaceae bacterium]|jgi:predicted histone-like DNA-binding protein|nr:DUF4469 domain-containing protein [Tannerellaceae bacterium]
MKYKLYGKNNPLNPESSGQWYAFPVYAEKISTEEVSREISERSTISPGDTDGLLTTLATILPERLAKGEPVYLRGIGTFRVSISSDGVENPNDFNASFIKSCKIIYTPDVKIQNKLAELIHYEDSGIRSSASANILWVADLLSNTANEKLSRGGSVRISGKNIMIQGEEHSVGLKLIHVESKQEFTIPLSDIPVNKAKEIVFIVPRNLPTGYYQIRVVTQYSNASTRNLKTPRADTYEPHFELV